MIIFLSESYKMVRHQFMLCLLAMCPAVIVSGGDVRDSLSTEKFENRAAERGNWSFQEGIASVFSDPELYKKYTNHGPILKWETNCSQGTTAFDMKSTDCQRVVFTLNGDGHIFRISLIDPEKAMNSFQKKSKSRMIAWAEKSSKANKGESLQPEGFPSLGELNNKWTHISVAVRENTASITIGDFQTSITHKAMQRDKEEITISFASGSFQLRDFTFQENK